MTDHLNLDDQVRQLLSAPRGKRSWQDLSELIDIRLDPFGNFVFVRKGASVDLQRVSPRDRVHVPDVRELHRIEKRRRFLELKQDPKYHGPIVLAEGDSWFEYPFATDLLEYAGQKYAVLSLARAGDTWANIIDEDAEVNGLPRKYADDGTLMGLLHNLRVADPRPFEYVLLSAGGNDLIGQIANCVYDYDPQRPEDKYIKHHGIDGFDAILNDVLGHYRYMTQKIVDMGKNVVLHTYDYPNPQEYGQYIGYPLSKRNIPGVGLMRRIVNEMIDLFCVGLKDVAAHPSGRVHLIDLRKTIGTNDYLNGPDQRLWKDEMHGDDQGFQLLWEKMDSGLQRIFEGSR